MKSVQVGYQQFLDLVEDKALLAQYVEQEDRYDLFAVEASVSWETSILKGTDESTDFEADHKANCNKPLEYRSTDGLLKTAPSKFVETLNLYVDGENADKSVTASSTEYAKTHYTFPYTLAGVDARWEGSNLGDYLDFEVGFYTDVEDEETWVSLNKFGNKYKILGSGNRLFDVPTVKVVPPTVEIAPGVVVDIYIRCKMVNVGPNNSKVVVNLVGWK